MQTALSLTPGLTVQRQQLQKRGSSKAVLSRPQLAARRGELIVPKALGKPKVESAQPPHCF
jgi:hypothetical protein